MRRYEYKVIPAPKTAPRSKGFRTAEDRFAHALSLAMNEAALDGWEYVRAETLPCEERRGLFRKLVVGVQHVLVFRRQMADAVDAPEMPGQRSASGERTTPRLRSVSRTDAGSPGGPNPPSPGE